MKAEKSIVKLFMDDDPEPFAELEAPVNFELDTRRLPDGEHTLTILGKDPAGREGIRRIPFVVRNGPSIAVEGIKEDAVVEGVLPIMVNAYGRGNQNRFLIEGSETPRSIPSWIWAALIVFFAWAAYYTITYF